MAAFNHIAAAVDPIYKALTRAPEHPMGGSAFLSTENAEEARGCSLGGASWASNCGSRLDLTN